MSPLNQILNALRRQPEPDASSKNSTAQQYLLFFVLAVALPLVILLSVELWMVTTYSGSISIGHFREQYFSGIYRYRILGRDQFLILYRFLHAHFADRPYPVVRDREAWFLSYATFALSNGLYFALSNLMLLSLLWIKGRGFADRELLFYLYYTLLLALSMAVVTPYDQLAYLLLLVGIWGARQRSAAAGTLLIAVSAIAGTLNRETEFLLASFLATMALVSPALQARRYWVYLAVDFTLSCAVYVALRLLEPGRVKLIEYPTHGGIWAPESIVELMLLFAAAIVFAMKLHRTVRPAMVLIAMCSPYIVTIFIGSSFRELRISMPILLCLFCVYLFLGRAAEVALDGNARTAEP